MLGGNSECGQGLQSMPSLKQPLLVPPEKVRTTLGDWAEATQQASKQLDMAGVLGLHCTLLVDMLCGRRGLENFPSILEGGR